MHAKEKGADIRSMALVTVTNKYKYTTPHSASTHVETLT